MFILQKMKTFLFPHRIPKEVISHIDDYNVKFSLAASIAALIISIIIVLQDDSNIMLKSISSVPLKRYYFAFIIVLIFIILLSLIYIFRKIRNHLFAGITISVFCLSYTVFGILLGLVNYACGDQILPFIGVEMFISAVLLLSPAPAVIFISVSFTSFLFLLSIKYGIKLKLCINTLMIWSICVFVSVRRFNYRIATESKSSRLKRLNSELEVISKYDALTGIRNRYSLRGDFDIYTGKKIFLMMSDVDDFKSFNDMKGHETGDKVLFRFANILSESFSRDSCYRYGGDEFLVIKPYTDESTFESCLVNCCRLMKDMKVDGEEINFSFSGGYIYGFAENHADIRNMIKQADEYLYKVKVNGKHNILGGEFKKDI